MQLRTKFAIVLLLVAIVLSGATFGALEFYKEQAVTQAQDNVQQRANLTAQQVSQTLRDREDYVGLYASRPSVGDFAQSDRRLATFLNNSRFNSAMIVARNGTVVDVAGPFSGDERRALEGSDFGDRTYVRAALGTDADTYIAEPARAETVDQWVVTISAPIYGTSTDRPVGVLVASTGLTRATGNSQLASAGFFDAIVPLETSTTSVGVRADIDGQRRYLHEPHRQFDGTVTGRASIEATGWEVLVNRDATLLQQRLETLALLQGASILVVLVTVVGLGIWEYRTNLSQAERLLDGFERLQEGEYDVSLSLSAAEEWRRISDGYNTLSTGIRDRERAIREHEQRLEVLNRVLRHNLKNDMSVIINYASLVAERADNDTLAQAGDKIEEMGQKLVAHGEKARMIEDAMSGSSERVQLDLVSATEDALAGFPSEYPDAEIDTDLPGTAPVLALPQLEGAIENVCENAIEHNDSDPQRLSVTVERTAEMVSVRVADNGPGIPDHEIEVLDAGEETALEHGSGVGLWLVHWVIENSGGELTFGESDLGGADVTLSLDAVEPMATDTEMEDTQSGDGTPETPVTGGG